MDGDRPLIATRSLTDAASVLIPFQNLLSQTAEVFLILTFECVAGCAKTHSKDLPISALAMQRTLNWTLHTYAPDEDRPLFALSGFLEREAASIPPNLNTDRPLRD